MLNTTPYMNDLDPNRPLVAKEGVVLEKDSDRPIFGDQIKSSIHVFKPTTPVAKIAVAVFFPVLLALLLVFLMGMILLLSVTGIFRSLLPKRR